MWLGHFWARIQKLGHEAVLLPPQHVRPYVLRNKTDSTDAKGLLEAYRNDDIRPVPIKTPTRQLLASLHRLRSAWLAERTARINTLRGLLREQGIVIPAGARHAVPLAWALRLRASRGYNKAAVALANKLARIVFCVWREGDASVKSLPQVA